MDNYAGSVPSHSHSHSHSHSTSNTSIFTRRPSFFGGRVKPPKTPTSSSSPSSSAPTTAPFHPLLAPAPARAIAADPPVISLDPAISPLTAIPPVLPPTSPPRRRHASRHSISSTLGDIGSQFQRSRSASIRTNDSSSNQSTQTNTTNTTANSSANTASSSSHRRTPSANLALSHSPEKHAQNTNGATSSANARPTLSISTFSRTKQHKSVENVKTDSAHRHAAYEKAPLSAVDAHGKTPFSMAMTPSGSRRPDANPMYTASGLGPAAPISLPSTNSANPNVIFQHIQEMASKRISTLDYLRKSHEGRIYWFNTLLFSKLDLTRLPSFTPRNLARRATHYLLLGFSLPTILDLNSSNPTDYLRALNALLLEFEQYQTMHPADGSAPSASRGRIPGMQMFKRANIGGKGRRSSSATGDFPILTSQNSFNGADNLPLDSPPENDLLLPNESYSYLQTPSLPFDPDFFSTFATLCDVLIDCYTKILSLLSSPDSIIVAGNGVPSTVGELFNKADARVRKIILAGVVREFEESCRQGVRSEVGGVGKVVLGGLM